MTTSEIVYQGSLRTEATHMQSGEKILTDAPLDNQGKGAAFSPTDLLATALGSCMLTIMGIAARERKLNLEGTKCAVTKVMGTDPRRVVEIKVSFSFPELGLTEKDRDILERAAKTCPVYYSLHPDIKKEIEFRY